MIQIADGAAATDAPDDSDAAEASDAADTAPPEGATVAASDAPGAESTHAPSQTLEQRTLEQLGDEIAELAAHIHAATYRLLVLIAAFDRRFQEEGGGLGFRSTAHWLSWRTGVGLGAAREKVRVARALETLPRISDGMRRGALSYSKVRALTRVATADNEAELLDFALAGTAAHVERLVRAWRQVDRNEAERETARRRAARHLSVYPEGDGTWAVRGRLEPEVGAMLRRALQAASAALYRDGLRSDSIEQRRADALGLLVECALRAGLQAAEDDEEQEEGEQEGAPLSGLRAEHVQLVVHAEAGGLRALEESLAPRESRAPDKEDEGAAGQPATGQAEPRPCCPKNVSAETSGTAPSGPGRSGTESGTGPGTPEVGVAPAHLAEGTRLSAETARRLACDAGRVVMRHGPESSVLDVGRKTRTVPAALRRALEHRDRGCRFPGCGLRFCDAHHVVHWADGGETRLDNLVLLCRRHHRAVHEEGFRVELREGEIRFFRPDGRPLPRAPQAPRAPAQPAAALRETHRDRGIVPDASTTTPGWLGGSFDLALTLDGLRKAGTRPSRTRNTSRSESIE